MDRRNKQSLFTECMITYFKKSQGIYKIHRELTNEFSKVACKVKHTKINPISIHGNVQLETEILKTRLFTIAPPN